MKRAVLALLCVASLAACDTNVYPSESYYTSSEAMRSASVNRCRVLEVRQVAIGAQSNGSVLGQPEVQIGSLAGLALGAAVGSQIGQGNGRTLAIALAGAAGSAAGKAKGAQLAQKRMSRAGLEYSVLTASGQEQVIVQHYNPGDRIAAPGSTCRIAGSGAGLRVLPGDQMPSSIARPNQTVFRG